MKNNANEKFETFFDNFINDFGNVLDMDWSNQTSGRITAALLFADEPISLEALSKKIKMSKSSVSQNIRILISTGLVCKVFSPSDPRKDYYIFSGEPLENLSKWFSNWIKKQIALTNKYYDKVLDNFSDVEIKSNNALKQFNNNINKFKYFYNELDKELDEVFCKLKEKMKKKFMEQ